MPSHAGRWTSRRIVASARLQPDLRPDQRLLSILHAHRRHWRDLRARDRPERRRRGYVGCRRTGGLEHAYRPGRLEANALVNYVEKWQAIEPNGGRVEYVGTIGFRALGSAIPRWRSLLGLRYGWQGLTFYSRWQHVDAMRDARYHDFRVPSRDYLDAGATYEFDDGCSTDSLRRSASRTCWMSRRRSSRATRNRTPSPHCTTCSGSATS